MSMTNQDKFEREAKAIVERNQATMDMKLFLSHWGGYKEVKTCHRKEIQDAAQKYGVDLDFRKWKLNGLWM